MKTERETNGRFRADNAIFDAWKEDKHTKLVYLYLCRCADKRGHSHPSAANIAWACSISQSSVHKALAKLTAKGQICRQTRLRKGGSQASSMTTIVSETRELALTTGLFTLKRSGWFFAPDALFDWRISASAKLAYVFFCRMAGQDASSYPSRKRIADCCAISLTSLARAAKELCEVGAIAKEARYRENGGQSSNLYVLCPFPTQARQTRLLDAKSLPAPPSMKKWRNSLADLHSFFRWSGGLSKYTPLEGVPTGGTDISREKNTDDLLRYFIPYTRPP